MKLLRIAALLAIGTTGQSVDASITLTLNQRGLADELGVAKNGMYIGIVVDTERNGFSFGQYAAFDVDLSGQFLPVSQELSDDYFFFAKTGLEGAPISGHTTTINHPVWGAGSVASLTDLFYPDVIAAGDPFALIWFTSNSAEVGSYYGILRAEHWLITGNDSLFSESTQIVPLGDTIAAQYVIVPEPSTYALAFGGLALGVVLWRRKKN